MGTGLNLADFQQLLASLMQALSHAVEPAGVALVSAEADASRDALITKPEAVQAVLRRAGSRRRATGAPAEGSEGPVAPGRSLGGRNLVLRLLVCSLGSVEGREPTDPLEVAAKVLDADWGAIVDRSSDPPATGRASVLRWVELAQQDLRSVVPGDPVLTLVASGRLPAWVVTLRLVCWAETEVESVREVRHAVRPTHGPSMPNVSQNSESSEQGDPVPFSDLSDQS